MTALNASSRTELPKVRRLTVLLDDGTHAWIIQDA
jgi:hypothetical protein